LNDAIEIWFYYYKDNMKTNSLNFYIFAFLKIAFNNLLVS